MEIYIFLQLTVHDCQPVACVPSIRPTCFNIQGAGWAEFPLTCHSIAPSLQQAVHLGEGVATKVVLAVYCDITTRAPDRLLKERPASWCPEP